MGTYYYLKNIDIDVTSSTFVPLVTFSMLVLFTAIGFAGVPFVVIAEILPQKLRGPVFTICLVVFSCLTTTTMTVSKILLHFKCNVILLLIFSHCWNMYRMKILIQCFTDIYTHDRSLGDLWLHMVICSI